MGLDKLGEHTFDCAASRVVGCHPEAVEALVQIHRRLQETAQRASPAVELDENVEGVGPHLEDQFQLFDVTGVRSAGGPELQLLDDGRGWPLRGSCSFSTWYKIIEALCGFEDGLLRGVGLTGSRRVARVEGAEYQARSCVECVRPSVGESYGRSKVKGIVRFSFAPTCSSRDVVLTSVYSWSIRHVCSRDHSDVDPVELLLVLAAEMYISPETISPGENDPRRGACPPGPADTDASSASEHDSSSRKLFPEPIFSRWCPSCTRLDVVVLARRRTSLTVFVAEVVDPEA